MKKLPAEFWLSNYGIKIIYSMRLRGFTLREISRKIGITIKEIKNLASENEEFMKAISIDPETADMLVEYALFEKAISGNVSGAINWLRVKRKDVWKGVCEKNSAEEKDGLTEIIAKAISDVGNEESENMFD